MLNIIHKQLLNLSASICFALSIVSAAKANEPRPLATFTEEAYYFEQHPFKHEIYASTKDNILVIDTITLKIINKIPVKGNPKGLAVSKDGTKLYVATSAIPQLVIIDLNSYRQLSQISLPYFPYEIKLGNNDHIYATPIKSNSGIMQINVATNQFEKTFGLFVDDWSITSDRSLLEISPDKNTLYMGSVDSSPACLLKFDISTDNPKSIYSNHKLGISGEDLVLSKNGDYIYYLAKSGNSGRSAHDIYRIRTADMTTQGSLPPGSYYPLRMGLSPDGKTAFLYEMLEVYSPADVFPKKISHISAWNTETQKWLCDIEDGNDEEITKLIVDSTASYLFAAFAKEIRVYKASC